MESDGCWTSVRSDHSLVEGFLAFPESNEVQILSSVQMISSVASLFPLTSNPTCP